MLKRFLGLILAGFGVAVVYDVAAPGSMVREMCGVASVVLGFLAVATIYSAGDDDDRTRPVTP